MLRGAEWDALVVAKNTFYIWWGAGLLKLSVPKNVYFQSFWHWLNFAGSKELAEWLKEGAHSFWEYALVVLW